jgi:hypothetical protein
VEVDRKKRRQDMQLDLVPKGLGNLQCVFERLKDMRRHPNDLGPLDEWAAVNGCTRGEALRRLPLGVAPISAADSFVYADCRVIRSCLRDFLQAEAALIL